MLRKLKKFAIMILLTSFTGCASLRDDDDSGPDKVQLPYLKNSANECYYLDEFMPVPDSMVAGKYGRLNLRYYTYRVAHYKDWNEKQVILSFYSQDDRCWSLYEESYIPD